MFTRMCHDVTECGKKSVKDLGPGPGLSRSEELDGLEPLRWVSESSGQPNTLGLLPNLTKAGESKGLIPLKHKVLFVFNGVAHVTPVNAAIIQNVICGFKMRALNPTSCLTVQLMKLQHFKHY